MKGERNIRNATTTIKLSCRRRCLWCLLYPKRSCLFAPHRRCRRPRRWDERGCQFESPPPPALQLLFLTNTHTPRSCGCCPASKQHASSYNTGTGVTVSVLCHCQRLPPPTAYWSSSHSSEVTTCRKTTIQTIRPIPYTAQLRLLAY